MNDNNNLIFFRINEESEDDLDINLFTTEDFEAIPTHDDSDDSHQSDEFEKTEKALDQDTSDTESDSSSD